MKAQYFIYTRNSENDYKLVFSPSDDFCPPETRKFFLMQARGSINIDTYPSNLDNPRWLFSRQGNLTLFGTGLMNSALSAECNTDYTGTPVRGFFGILFDNTSINCIPFDIEFFKEIYAKHIVPLWNTSKDEFKKKGVDIDIEFERFNTIEATNFNLPLNTNNYKSVILGNSVKENELMAEAMATINDVSVITALDDKLHAYDSKYRYMNAIVIGVDIREERIHKRETEVISEGPVIVQPKNPDKPKKALRLKLIIAIGIIATIVIIIILMNGKTATTPILKNSNSGDSIRESQIQKQAPSLNMDCSKEKK
ncbi:hypothetical protein [Bacteroides oleiciplenus]|uniref:hypothetical protein n=1 Tax=Bacteroides oleiciplenus TaxID=626931 RepID=UPI0026DB79E3|nr:hypothetical protein [Bacteroides oleiciplenus]